jgi:hypothetical protein
LELLGRGSALPGDLVLKRLGAEDSVEEQLQVMTRGGIAMKVQRAGLLERAVKFDQPRNHHREIGQHVIRAEEQPKDLQRLRDLAACFNRLLIGAAAPWSDSQVSSNA